MPLSLYSRGEVDVVPLGKQQYVAKKVRSFVRQSLPQIIFRQPALAPATAELIPNLSKLAHFLMHLQYEPVSVPLETVGRRISCRGFFELSCQVVQHKESPQRGENVLIMFSIPTHSSIASNPSAGGETLSAVSGLQGGRSCVRNKGGTNELWTA